ncbi:ABC transporter substrate-binding protein [Arcanobacterium phocae]|uniref:ABC transporter substrate-binding protein n=1 Tax=Arcanobacterium phocae TaxID=131112 RepID=UPI001C0EF773|nr:extracellular solute-binding protein [Arcanobacterium phocae]
MTTLSHRSKVAAVLATVSLAAAGLAGCSSDSAGKASSGEDGKTEAKLEYVHRLPDGEGMVKVQEIVDRWNKDHPDMTVKATKFDGKAADLFQKLEKDVATDTAPCLAQLGYSEVPEAFVKGMVEDVTKQAEKYKDNFSGAYGQMAAGGKVVGLPQDTGPLVYFYDKAEFDALGLSVPTTLDELKETAKKAAEQGKYILNFEPDEAAHWLSAQAAAVGDPWFTTENDKWKINTQNKGSEVVANFWQELIDAKAVTTINRWDDAYTKALTDKKVIGNIGAAWEAGFMLDPVVPEDAEGTWRVALLPDFGEGVKTGPDGGSGVAVMKGCKYIDEAMEFNNWFNTQTADLATQGLVVAAKGDVTTPEKIKRQFGGQDVFTELAKANQGLNPDFQYIPGFSAVGQKMVDTAANVIDSKGKIADIFAAAQEESMKTLKNLKLPVAE